MLFALIVYASLVPMRWASADPKALDLLAGTPVNCLLLEQDRWAPGLVTEARSRNLTLLGVIRPGAAARAQAVRAASLKLDGAVLEGDFEPAALTEIRGALQQAKLEIVEMPSRAGLRFDGTPAPKVIATWQGVWPGIQAEEDGKAHAAPSGAPWIHTNGGFLRFARAAASPDAAVWIGNRAPSNTVITPERYMQAIADAAIIGARWVIDLDEEFRRRLEARDAPALTGWKKMMDLASWFETTGAEWRTARPLSRLALVQDSDSGALYSGGVLDMIAVKHTPVLPVPTHSLSPAALQNATMAVTVDPSALTPEQKDALAAMRRKGGSTLSGPGNWKFPPTTPDRITLSEQDVKTLDEIWREVNQMTGRSNLGARLFNVSSMLSSLMVSADGRKAWLNLVNYSGYPVENVTVHLLKRYRTATLIAPGERPKALTPYDNEEGSGVDIDSVASVATLVVE